MNDITATDAFAAVISGTTPMARELGRANARVAVRRTAMPYITARPC